MSDKLDFEKNLNAIEDIIKKLESNDCSLDESILLFEEGMKYMSECKKALGVAEARIKKEIGEAVD